MISRVCSCCIFASRWLVLISVLRISAQVSSWSRRWFTHIFLFVIVLLYSIGGAMIFVTIEGTNEDMAHGNIRKERWVHRYEASRLVFFKCRLLVFWYFWLSLTLAYCPFSSLTNDRRQRFFVRDSIKKLKHFSFLRTRERLGKIYSAVRKFEDSRVSKFEKSK